MLRTKHSRVTIPALRVLFLCALFLLTSAGPPEAKSARRQPAASPVVATSGGYQLTTQMVNRALRFGQILAGAEFDPSDIAALRGDLIAMFQKEPVKQREAYDAIAKNLQGLPRRRASWLNLATVRYKVWQWYGENQRAFRDFQSYPFGKTVLKYNPVLVDSGGMVITKTDVVCQFYSDAVVAKAAGVAPPSEAEKDDFTRNLPRRFAAMPKEQQEYLRQAELRLIHLLQVYDGTVKTRAAVVADIRKSVHSSEDVSRAARRVENDARYGSKYYRLYRVEALNAVAHANRVNARIMGFGAAMRSIMRSGDINTPLR